MELKDFVFEGSCLGKSILIAEDEAINSYFLEELFAASKAKVYCAVNGLEAVNIMRKHPEIELILMDIKMPHMSGYEATPLVKEINPAVKVIATTAFALQDDEEAVRSVGCDSYVTKPINVNVLVNEVRRVLF